MGSESFIGWNSDPFSFRILSDFFVGYDAEKGRIVNSINDGGKFFLFLGPTGAGKTTFIRHLMKLFSQRKALFIPKPPKEPEDWIAVFRPVTKGLLFSAKDTTLYNLSERMNSKLNGRKLLVFLDECHEASTESLEWIRTIADQTDSMALVMAGLPAFEGRMKETLETLLKRVTVQVKLSNLSRSETRELMKRRIEAAGGEDIRPFTQEAVDEVYNHTAGFPREVLRMCGELAQAAREKGISTIDANFIRETQGNVKRVPIDTIDMIPERQRHVLEILATAPMTPGEIAVKMHATYPEDYKNEGNAVRSANNILKRLMQDGFAERSKAPKGYRYKVSTKYSTLLVKA
ncbi:MAG: AAA family ATPase [Candidatus Aenigmarchaeota archaeon]|nr:AAA family ATPase [Candidatus Aenigmarchaeota archaeon]